METENQIKISVIRVGTFEHYPFPCTDTVGKNNYY